MSERTRFVPIRRRDLLPRLLVERRGDQAFEHVANVLHHVLAYEATRRAERLQEAYEPFDPDPLAPSLEPEHDEPGPFLEALDEVLEEANFRTVSMDEVRAAFGEQSLFPLRVDVDLDDYDVLRLYRRAIGERTERVRGWKTLWRWRSIEVHYYERLIVALRLKPEALEDPRNIYASDMEPGKVYLKSFKNIPRADLEMVLPNGRFVLRPIDRAIVGGPLVAGVGYTLFQSLAVLVALVTGAFALSLDDPAVQAVGGVLLVLGGYLWKTLGKIKTTRLRYLRTLSQGLYFRNLANNRAVLDQSLRTALDEEEKECLLAYHFLTRQGPMKKQEIDAAAEAWIKQRTARDVDFDVADALQRLEGLGIVARKRLKWHAVAPEEGAAVLDQRWDAAFGAKA